MAIPQVNLSLNDFRNVLGKVNDGNVVFKDDGSGVEKVNYGSAIAKLFGRTRALPSNPEENRKVRAMLLAAIQNSAEGKILTKETMDRIYAALGMPNGADIEDMGRPLSRRELKAAIEIIDQSTLRNALIKKDMQALKAAGLYDENVVKGVDMAMNGAEFLKREQDRKAGLARMKEIFGNDFRGMNPEAMFKFFRNNYAVIRELVYDRLYWNCPGLKDFSDATPDNLNIAMIEDEENNGVEISGEEVRKAFKEVVGELMDKYASGAIVTVKGEILAPEVEEAAHNDENAAKVWKDVIGGGQLERLVLSLFGGTKETTGVFAALQLDRAGQALANSLVKTFNQLYADNHFQTQATETAFKEKTGALVQVLNEILEDINAMDPETASRVRVKIADEIGRLVQEKSVHEFPGRLADVAKKALDEAVKPFSTRHTVENYVNAKFAYLEDRKPVVDFFMAKIAAAGTDEGITAGQKAELVKFQKAAFAGGADAARQDLELNVLDPLTAQYNAKVESEDPEKVRNMRRIRNAAAFEKLMQADPQNAALDDAKRADALVQMKLDTLFAKYTNAEVAGFGIIEVGDMHVLKDETQVRNPETGIVEVTSKTNEEAVGKLDEKLLEMDDKEFEFYSQYSAKGMGKADEDFAMFSKAFGQGDPGKIFATALKDGAFTVADIPKNAVHVLHSLMTAQLFAPRAEDGNFVSVRDILPEVDKTGDVSTALVARFSERFAASGLKPVPDIFRPVPGGEDVKSIALRLNNQEHDNFLKVRGFGTFDLGRILKLLAGMGVDISALDGDQNARIDFYEKVTCLSMLSAMSGHKLDGLAEFTERICGKPFAEVDFTDVLKALSKAGKIAGGSCEDNVVVPDPLSKFSGQAKAVKELFAGEAPLANAKLSAAEATELLAKAHSLAAAMPGETKTETVVLKGVSVGLTRLVGGGLRVVTNNLPYRAAFDASGLVRMIENEVASKPQDFDAEVVKSALPKIEDVKNGKIPLVRARELYAKTAAAITGTLPVMFSHYTTGQMREIAIKAVEGKFKAKDLPAEAPATYNSGAMIEMHEALSLTSARDIETKVRIRAPEAKSIELRRSVPPDAQTVRNVIADLFLNKDTWEFDAGASGGAKPGERIRKLLVEHAPELAFILKSLDANAPEGLDLLAFLPQQTRDAVRGVLADIKNFDLGSLANAQAVSQETRQALAAIEAKIDVVAGSLVDSLQAKVTALFAPKAGVADANAPWQKTFAELNGKEGIDVATKQGAFTMKVLQNYFKNSALVDKRAMLSAYIRNTGPESTDARQVAELLKGAGPLLQKMLQGLPLSSFDADTQLALKDMKSRLLPIPDEAVKAQMLELVRSSNGEILSIEVKKSLGAASVGQAFLCTIRTKAHPYQGEECVVKLLRPNVDTAIQRDKALIDKLVADDPAMKATFDGQYRKILEEFDLTLESSNVAIGTTVYDRPGGTATVHTMEMLPGTQSTMTSMIVKKADGETFDGYVERIRRDSDSLVAPFRQVAIVDGREKVTYKAPAADVMAETRRTLVGKIAQLGDRRNQILDIAKAWFENALFGNGFFHGDLHGGNLMTGANGTTFIDFGNCSRLAPAEQDAIKLMLATIVSGHLDHTVSNFLKLLPQEAQDAFKAKFPAGSDAEKSLFEILKRGTANDLMPRLQAFLSAVQGADVPIPPALQNFVQSYMRLNDIISEIDRASSDIRLLAQSIYCDLPAVEPEEGDSLLMAGIKNVARAFVGSAGESFTVEAVDEAADEVAAYFHNFPDEAENDILALTKDAQTVFDKLDPFVEKLYGVRQSQRSSLEPTDGQGRAPGGVSELSGKISRLRTLKDEGRLDTPEAAELIEEMRTDLRELAANMASSFRSSMETVYGHDHSYFTNVAAKRDEEMTDVCSAVIFSHQNELVGIATAEFLFGVYSFGVALKSNFTAAKQADARRKNVGDALAGENMRFPKGQRLSGPEMAVILRETGTFLVPLPRPDEKDGWQKDKANRTVLLDAIGYNLSRLARTQEHEPGTHLNEAAIVCSALNFALRDGKLVNSICGLEQDEYNQLLAEAEEIDAANGGGNEISTAIAAIREKGEDLLSEVAGEEDDE